MQRVLSEMQKVRTRILILSDTHTASPQPPTFTTHAFREPLPEADIAIHAGDLTYTGKIEEHESGLALLKSLKAEIKIVIPGNHDLSLDTAYYENPSTHIYSHRPKYTRTQLDEIRHMYTGAAAKAAGITYMEEGTRRLRLKNGVEFTVHASAYTPEFCNWAFAYNHDVDRFNPPRAATPVPLYVPRDTRAAGAMDTNIDILITHGPPYGILDVTDRGQEHVGCPHLLKAAARSRPLLHCFGHIHEGWGAVQKTWPKELARDDAADQGEEAPDLDVISQGEEVPVEVDYDQLLTERAALVDGTHLQHGQQTMFVNASIMSVRYKPKQSPWLVDLMLNKPDSTLESTD